MKSKQWTYAESKIPTEYGMFNLRVYQTDDANEKEPIAFYYGQLNDGGDIPVVRIHSECLTGEVFGSQRCDCAPQLYFALKMISERGKGILIYLRQEGRGIGLFNKIRAYDLQDQGYDTIEANRMLGLEVDARDYSMAYEILQHFDVKEIDLITNNPEKASFMKEHIKVNKIINTDVGINKYSYDYLLTKQKYMKHEISLTEKDILHSL